MEETTNAYELQRLQIIARNRARLLALGIPQAVAGLAKLQSAKPAKAPRAPRKPSEPREPSRQSSRLRDKDMIARGEVPPDIEPGSELAMFIIDGECPRCGKVLSSGHARHLEGCKGPPEPPTEEEIAAQAEAYKQQQKDKLRQLELGGLVDYQPGTAAAAAEEPNTKKLKMDEAAAEGTTQPEEQQEQQKSDRKGKKKAASRGSKKTAGEAAAAAAAAAVDDGGASATFIVIGSKGDHYVIKITDEKRSCQCMDYRFRRHDCKHIRLILQQLGVADNPSGWEQALCQQLDGLSSADDQDVVRVREAKERALARKQKAAAREEAAAQKRAEAAAAEADAAADAEGTGGDAAAEPERHQAHDLDAEEAGDAGAAGTASNGKQQKKAAAGNKRKKGSR